MSRKAWPVILLVLLALVANVTGAAARSHASEAREVTFQELGYEKDETLKGVLATRNFVVRWPDAWKVQPGNTLHLVFSHSKALHPTSSMAVDWNGTRLDSVLLNEENAETSTLEVKIPESLIVTGYNTLHVEFYMGIQEDFCADEDNPALWATVHSSSSIGFSYQPAVPETDLSLYPLPLIDNSPLQDNQVTFVVPSRPTTAEINAVAVVSARLGQLAGWRPVDVDVIIEPADLAGLPGNSDLIFVGSPSRLKLLAGLDIPRDGGKINTPEGKPVQDGAGVVWEQVSPANPASVLIALTGSDEQAVLLAARALGSTSAYARFSGPMGVVLDVPESAGLPDLTPGTFTLEQLGYSDIAGQGSREQTIDYVLRLPGSWQNQSEVVLDLHFGHSKVLDEDRSSLTVKVNDIPVGSLALTGENAENGRATFHIPARLFKLGSNQVSIAGNLTLPEAYLEGAYCLDQDYRDAWLVVYADTQIHLPGGPSGYYASLEDYPAAFTGSPDLSQVAFVLPASPSIEMAKATASIAAGLGQSAAGDSLFPHVLDSQALYAMEQPYAHLFLIGRPTQNAAIAQANGSLPLGYEPGTDQAAATDVVAQTVPPQGDSGSIQLISGRQGLPALVVTGSSDQGVLWAARALNNPALRDNLKGNLAVFDGETSVTAVETRSRISPVAGGENSAAQGDGVQWRITSWIAVLTGVVLAAALIVLLVFALRNYRKDQKARMGYESQSA